jgi:hypothetical protein
MTRIELAGRSNFLFNLRILQTKVKVIVSKSLFLVVLQVRRKNERFTPPLLLVELEILTSMKFFYKRFFEAL